MRTVKTITRKLNNARIYITASFQGLTIRTPFQSSNDYSVLQAITVAEGKLNAGIVINSL